LIYLELKLIIIKFKLKMGTCCQPEAQQAATKAEMDIPGTMKPRQSHTP